MMPAKRGLIVEVTENDMIGGGGNPKVQDRTGMLFGSWELGRDYGLTDYDGRRPDWGRHKIDFSVLPPTWIDLFRTGSDLEIKWLTTLAARTKKFRAKIPS